MNIRGTASVVTLVLLTTLALGITPAAAQQPKPNIILILSDDFGYGDSGPYGGGPGRGMPTPSLDRLADEGMTFFSFFAQPSCTPGRAAVQTGRIPNRSGMTTVAFQGQGGRRMTLHSVVTLFNAPWPSSRSTGAVATWAAVSRATESG